MKKGTNRISSRRLFDIAHVMGIAVSGFFEDMNDGIKEQTPAKLLGSHRLPEPDG
jgi:hypothetical protein